MIEPKLKICTKGNSKAKDFEGCGKSTYKTTYGICDGCLTSWWFTTENGKIDYAKKKLKKSKSNWSDQKKVLKEKVKTLSDYENEAKKSFQKFIRLRDQNNPCISCQNPNPSDWCGSHYFAAGVYSGMIFDERNCHGACNTYCNKFLSGNLNEYRINLVIKFGEDWVKQLENDALERKKYKYTKSELIEIKKKYDLKIKQFN